MNVSMAMVGDLGVLAITGCTGVRRACGRAIINVFVLVRIVMRVRVVPEMGGRRRFLRPAFQSIANPDSCRVGSIERDEQGEKKDNQATHDGQSLAVGIRLVDRREVTIM